MKATKPKLILMSGLPGSGKTTMAQTLAKEFSAIQLSADEWIWLLGGNLRAQKLRQQIEQQLNSLAYELLDNGQSVILEHGFWSKKERDELRIKGLQHGAEVCLVHLDTDIDTLWQRLNERNTDPAWGGANFSRDELEQWSNSFEGPADEELKLFTPLPEF